jgi:hypothetical protein
MARWLLVLYFSILAFVVVVGAAYGVDLSPKFRLHLDTSKGVFDLNCLNLGADLICVEKRT